MRLLTSKFWLEMIPIYHANTLRVLFIAFLSMMIIGALIRMLSKRRMKDKLKLEAARRIATLFVTMGVFGLWYWFVAFEQISFLSSRFWLILWLAGGLIWIVSIIKFIRVKAPDIDEEKKAREEKEKYFQKKRKK